MALCLYHVWLFSFINSHFSPRNSILSVFSIFVCCTLWFVTHNKRAERTVHISTFLQKTEICIPGDSPATRVSFELCVRKVMFGVSKHPTNWHWHWAEMIHWRKTEEWSFSSEKGIFMEVITDLQSPPLVVLVQLTSLSFSGKNHHK